MIETVTLVGIGTGNPGHLTLDGAEALTSADTILVPRKGTGKDDLAEIRLALLDRLGVTARVAFFDYPVRDESLPYLERVERWHDEIAARWAEAAGAAKSVALLVWGDPSFYDSTMRIAERLQKLYVRTLSRGIEAGEFREDLEPGVAARLIATVIHGLQVMGKASMARRDARRQVALLLDSFG